MPKARINDIDLYYEETGEGTPLVCAHEFAGDCRSWEPQARYFSRRYRVITYNARGYPPSGVPEDPSRYSQDIVVADLLGLLDHLGIDRAHIVGCSMGGFTTLIFGLRHPERARSLTLVGCGYGSDADRSVFEREVEQVAVRTEREGMQQVAEVYARGPTRVQFADKDPRGWHEFYEQLKASSTLGHTNMLRGVQKKRPSIRDLEPEMRDLTVPTLIVTGDEDEPCLEPSLLMKRTIPTAALVVLPRTGHAVNLEEPDAFNRHLADFWAQVDAGRWRLRNPASLSPSALLPVADREG